MSGTVKDLVTLSLMVGLGIAVLTNLTGAQKLIDAVSGNWITLIRVSSGQPTNLRGKLQ